MQHATCRLITRTARRVPPIHFALGIFSAGILGLAAAASAQVINGSFDENGGSLSSWGTFGNTISNVSAQALTPHSGSHVAKLFGQFNGATNYSGIAQSGPVTPGQLVRASGWFRHNANDRLAGANRLTLKLEFYSSWGGEYGTPAMLSETAVLVVDANTLPNVWTQHEVTAPVPPNAVEVRLALVFMQQDNAAGAALADDVTLTADGAPPAPTGWTQIWGDEFDGATVDASKWRVENAFLIKNNEQQYYAPDDVYVQNGKLILRSQARWYDGHPYTSGLVDTQGRFAQVHGRWEIRAKLPAGKGLWPAHWMMPVRPVWPPEIDIMEATGDLPWRVVMSLHWGSMGPNGEPPWQIGHTDNTQYWGADHSQGFHTFAIEWWPDALVWFVDGVQRFASVRQEVPDEPFYLILNSAVGGDWPGSPDGSTVFPQFHEIDYVRVYAPSNPGAGLATFNDGTSAGAHPDGAIGSSEYAGTSSGINRGLFRALGEDCTLQLETSAAGRLNLGFESVSAWATTGPWCAVVYVDSQPGGFASTYELNDRTDLYRRAVSGKGMTSQRADLYFAPGFLADYALCLGPGNAGLYQLGRSAHTLIASGSLATDGACTADPICYTTNSSAGGKVREVDALLADAGIGPTETFRLFATLINGDTAFRANEFNGVAPGNAFDAANIGANTAVLKWGDFLTVRAAAGYGDIDADGDVDATDFIACADCLHGPGQTPAPVTHTIDACVNTFDANGDGDVDLQDFAAMDAQQ
jgi:beta-glucanase (GH16 family)